MRRMPQRRPAKKRPPAPALERAHVLFWPFGLHGNPGAELGVEQLFDAFSGALGEALDDPASRLHPLAQRTDAEMIDYAEPEEMLRWREELRSRFADALEARALPVFVGGNHLVLLPILEAYAASPAERTLVVSFDAHIDAYDLPGSRERLHHGNFLAHVDRPAHLSIAAVGHRDHVLTEAAAKERLDHVLSMDVIARRPLEASVDTLASLAGHADRVHLDIDLDVLDPSALRAVGTPMPCGLSTRELTALVEPLLGPKLSGVSVSEYSAAADPDGTGRQLVCWLLEHVLLRRFGG